MSNQLAWQRRFRRWHKTIAIITAIQLLAWTGSGVFFAFVDIKKVRGEHHQRIDTRTLPALTLPKFDEATAKTIAIRQRLDGEVILGVSAADSMQWLSVAGDPIEALNAEGALFMAGLQTDLAADTADWVDIDVVGSEYRGRALPLWRVFNSNDPSLVAYVDVYSGQVTAIRSDAWRWWDFLWALHIMDYDDRDDIGTVLLKIFSVLAVLTAIAGIALYFLIPRKKTA